MEKWVEIRRKVLAKEAGKRAICREYKLHWDTLQRILKYPEPPKYEQKRPRKNPKIGEFVPIIHEILESDQQVHRKQRHTAKIIGSREREVTREFIKVLRLLEHASPGELGKAIDYALDIGTTEADDPGGMREGSVPLCPRERGSSGVPPSAL
jgi:hypothetical protein